MFAYNDEYLERTLRMAFESPDHYKLPRGVIRYDYAHTHGWRARLTRDRAKFEQMYYDGQSGSIESGLRKAIQYRHEILSSFPITITKTFSRTLSPDPEQRIRLGTEKGRHQPYVSWTAKWYDEQYNIKKKQFSVQKFGNEGARALALKATTENHNSVPRVFTVHDPHQDDIWRTELRADVEAQASVNSDPYSKNESLQEVVQSSYPFGFEGERKFALHVSIERNRKLRDQRVAEFLTEYGKLFCELCSFRFLERYPFLTSDIIEVHHITPLAKLSSATKTKTSDLMLLCSNCHTAIHQGDAEENLVAAIVHFEEGQNDR